MHELVIPERKNINSPKGKKNYKNPTGNDSMQIPLYAHCRAVNRLQICPDPGLPGTFGQLPLTASILNHFPQYATETLHSRCSRTWKSWEVLINIFDFQLPLLQSSGIAVMHREISKGKQSEGKDKSKGP